MSQSALETINTDPRLVFELAAGVESLESIATRYELDIGLLRELMATPRLKKVVLEKRKELDETGYTLAAKAKLCFEDLLGDVYRKAKGVDSSLQATLAAAEFFRKVSGLDKQEISLSQDKFTITINIGNTGSPPTVIDLAPDEPVEPKEDIPSFLSTLANIKLPSLNDLYTDAECDAVLA